MWVAPCSWRTRISLIFESTSASKIGIAAPPDRPKTYSTPSRSRQRISASAPVCSLVTGMAVGAGVEAGADLVAGDAGTETSLSKGEVQRYVEFTPPSSHFEETLI